VIIDLTHLLDIEIENYTQKTAGKVSAMFRCSTVNFYASISLKVDKATEQIQRPIEVKNTKY